MRSSRSAPDPLDPGRNGFAHRGLHHAPAIIENSFAAFAAALELGAGIECDLRLTADGEIVVFHDRDATRLCGDPSEIGKSTLAELGRLQVGGRPIPTLAGLLALVSGRVPLLLEIKVDDNVWRWAPALREALGEYRGPFGIMSFDPRIARLLKTNWPEARSGLVIRDSLPLLRRWWAMRVADPQFLAVEVAALGKPWVEKARTAMPVYSWTSRSRDDARRIRNFADAAIWEADGRP